MKKIQETQNNAFTSLTDRMSSALQGYSSKLDDIISSHSSHIEQLLIKGFQNRTMPMKEFYASYKCAMMEIETKFRVLDEQFSLSHDRNPIESISTRLKSPEAIYEKARRKGIPLRADALEENMFDIAGVRVVCAFEDDIYMLRDCLLSQDDVTLIEERDYIRNQKESGYRSLHLIVETPIFLQNEKRMMKVEIQLRTMAMDQWASLEHRLMYKKDLPESIKVEIRQELLECAALTERLDTIMQSIKNTTDQYQN